MLDILQKGDPIIYFLGFSGVIKHAIYYYWKDRRPADAKLAGHVKHLRIFPLKSARGIEKNQLQCSPSLGIHDGGLADRHWMVVTTEMKMVTGRHVPKLLTITTRSEGGKLVLSALGMTEITLDPTRVEKLGKVIDTEVHFVPVQGLDCGEDAAQWISNFLQSPGGFRFLYCGSAIYRRQVHGGNNNYIPWTKVAKPEDKLAFHDSISVHVCSEESVADLNTRTPRPVTIGRFRPNIAVTTHAPPYDEDTWRYVYVGTACLRVVKLCSRCTMTTGDSEAGKLDEDENPLRTLKEYRSIVRGLGPAFGIDLIVEKPGTIRVGDPIYVTRGDNITRP